MQGPQGPPDVVDEIAMGFGAPGAFVMLVYKVHELWAEDVFCVPYSHIVILELFAPTLY